MLDKNAELRSCSKVSPHFMGPSLNQNILSVPLVSTRKISDPTLDPALSASF